MKRPFHLLFVFVFSLSCFAQTAPSKYWIKFKDKNSNPYTLSNPSAFLSQRAIDRRNKQAIPVIANDLPLTPSYIISVLSTGAVKLMNRSKWFNAITIQTTDSNALAAIDTLPFVEKVEPVGMIKWRDNEIFYEAQKKKSDPEAQSNIAKPSLAYSYGISYDQVSMLGIECMHSKGYDGKGLVIAVLDAGFYRVDSISAFDSLWNNNRILGTWDFVTGDSMVFEDASHGMYVLSTMGAQLSGQMIGTAPKANYWLLRSEEAATEFVVEEDNWVAAAEFADSVGADIINSSLGYTTFDDPDQDHSYADMDGNTTRVTIGADMAASKGIVVVNSAGNSGASSWHYIGAPADGDSVLTIGAVDVFGSYASFSSVGPTYDGRIKPDVVAVGMGTTVAENPTGVIQGNGTSFSSPLIAGAVACLWQANPSLTAAQLREAIQKSGTQSNNPDNFLGYGIPNFCVANEILLGVDPQKFSNDNLIKIYPSPFDDKIEFSFFSTFKQDIIMELTDVRGRRLAYGETSLSSNSYNNYTINDLSSLGGGLYLLNVYTPNGKYVFKVVKR